MDVHGAVNKDVPVLVLEGTDASGKSSIAKALADRLGGRVVKPYAGTVGDLMRWLHEVANDYKLLNRVAKAEIARATAVNSDARFLIFDRHWLSILSVMPVSLVDHWQPLPPTVVCVVDASVARDRLLARDTPRLEVDRSSHFVRRFRDLAETNSLPVIDTSATSVEQAVDSIIARGLADHLIAASSGG